MPQQLDDQSASCCIPRGCYDYLNVGRACEAHASCRNPPPLVFFSCNLLHNSLTQQSLHPGCIKQYICFSEDFAVQLTQQVFTDV